jgi:phosphohistidine swiveling domain-containing protein
VTSTVGEGAPSFVFPETTGRIKRFVSPQDVIAAMDDDLGSTIALVASGGTTFLSPILGLLGGIVALDGTVRSHLGIVSREFEVACLVGTTLTTDVADGTEVTLSPGDGRVGTITLVGSSA